MVNSDRAAVPVTLAVITEHPGREGLVGTVTLEVPDMVCRDGLRTVSSCVRDVPGVVTVQADVDARRVVLTGSTSPLAAVTAMHECGFHGRLLR